MKRYFSLAATMSPTLTQPLSGPGLERCNSDDCVKRYRSEVESNGWQGSSFQSGRGRARASLKLPKLLNEQLEALKAARFSHAHSLISPFPSPFPPINTGPLEMLSRFAPRAFVAPVRYNVPVRSTAFSPVVRRSVTTDAASSHAEKSEVPSVCISIYLQP